MSKKFFNIVLSVIFIIHSQSFCLASLWMQDENEFSDISLSKYSHPSSKKNFIEDENVKNLKEKNLARPQVNNEIIEDEVAASLKNKNISKPVVQNDLLIEDEIIKEKFQGRTIYKQKFVELPLIEDNYLLVDKTKDFKKVAYVEPLIKENTKEIKVPISSYLPIMSYGMSLESSNSQFLSSEHIGDKINLRVVKDVFKDGEKFIAKNTQVEAIVGNITLPAQGGNPGEIVIERFSTYDINQNKINLCGNIKKRGASTTALYYILGYGGLPFSFGLSIFLLYLPGMPATIKPNKVYNLIYEY